MRTIALALLLAGVALALPHDSASGTETERPRLEARQTPGDNTGGSAGSGSGSAGAGSATTGVSIGKFAILGDSFASGVAWLYWKRYNLIDTENCRRYKYAYGPQMEADGRLGPNAKIQFLACSGSRTYNVSEKQIPAIPLDVSFATLSVGGNDVGFFPVMDACVLRSSKGLTDDDCKNQVSSTAVNIKRDVPGYKSLYKSVLDRGMTDPNFKLYVLGYPHFFNVDTDQCNGATFAFYKDNKGGPFLTKDLRNTINGLIQQMNEAIRAAVSAVNDKRVVFVDLSPVLGGHRFCESGINEPYSGGPTGIDDKAAWLYHFDWNLLHELDAKPGASTNYTNATFACDAGLLAANDMGAVLQCGFVKSGVTSLKFAGTLVERQDGDPHGSEAEGSELLATGDSADPGQYGLFQRTFHPTYLGHMAIKDAIFAAIGIH